MIDELIGILSGLKLLVTTVADCLQHIKEDRELN